MEFGPTHGRLHNAQHLRIATSRAALYIAALMRKSLAVLVLLLGAGLALLAFPGQDPKSNGLWFEGEKHLANIRQLTHGGENAEAYWSIDDKKLIFQSAHGDVKCDQIFIMNADGSDMHMVSTGKGRTTCSYIFPDGKHILYASTHGGSPECPPPPDFSKGYRWMLYPDYDIYFADVDGKNVRKLTDTPGYDAEATISRDGKRIAFTSERNGDLDVYTMDPDGKNVKQLTHESGYDGGPFWSYDGKWIVYRAYHPKTPEEIAEYKELMREHAIKPIALELWVMRADGSDKHQLTSNGAANFAPYFFPDGKKIIFSSNMASAKGMGNFDLYTINVDGSGLERITTNPTFDGFPMFTSDGKTIVFASNRNASKPHETNVFVADWVK
jgi:Tol biopolymer transport system component